MTVRPARKSSRRPYVFVVGESCDFMDSVYTVINIILGHWLEILKEHVFFSREFVARPGLGRRARPENH